jgi:hypothetical protein
MSKARLYAKRAVTCLEMARSCPSEYAEIWIQAGRSWQILLEQQEREDARDENFLLLKLPTFNDF